MTSKKTTLKKLYTVALKATKGVFTIESEIEPMVNYLLDHTIGSIDHKFFNARSWTEVGVGVAGGEKEFKEPKILMFTMKQKAGGRKNFGFSEFNNISSIEDALCSELYDYSPLYRHDPEPFIIDEAVAVIEGVARSFKRVEKETAPNFIRASVEWVDFEPYELHFFKDGRHTSEPFNSLLKVENRVLELLEQDATHIWVNDRIAEKKMMFTISKDLYRSEKNTFTNAASEKPTFMWELWTAFGLDEEDDDDDDCED